jgi:threonine synthase
MILIESNRSFPKIAGVWNQHQVFWRYQALLPVSNAASKISLGEVITPLIPLKESSKLLGGKT